MKTGMELQDLAVELKRQSEVKRDFLADRTGLTFKASSRADDEGKTPATGTLTLKGNGDFKVTELAHRQIATRLEIPQRYYDKMRLENPGLWQDNVSAWLNRNEDRYLVRSMDNRIRALLSSSYRPLDNWDMAETVLPIMQDVGAKVMSSALTESRLYIKAVCPGMAADVQYLKEGKKVGDVIQAGVSVSNSEVGAGSLKIEPFIFTLSCTNGAIASDYSLRKFHIGRGLEVEGASEYFQDETRRADDRAFWLKVRDVVRAAYNEELFGKMAERLNFTTTKKITRDPITAVELTAKKFGFQEDEKKGVLLHLMMGGTLTQYGLLNAVTRQSQDIADYDRATEFERIGGKIMDITEGEWKAIAE